jgi:hypothetical protein
MKPRLANRSLSSWPRAGESAFTLVELATAMAASLLVVLAVICSQLAGMRMNIATQSKLNATHNARAVLNRVRDEIRSGRILVVGSGDDTRFTHVTANSPQEGNALQIYPTADTNTFVRYYLDRAGRKLKRVASGNSQATEIAGCITNQLVFRAEDYRGNTLTNDQNNRVIKMTLEFYQWEFATMGGAGSGLYDYCRLETKITRRVIE